MRRSSWLTWLLGGAMLAAVVWATVHFAEAREFVELVERAHPSWLGIALVLQVLTYVAQGEVFLITPHASGSPVSRRFAYELSLSKLFLDQAVPSAGLASTALVATAMEQRGVPRGPTAAGAILNVVSYHSAYAALLLGALAVMAALGKTSAPVLVVSLLFLVFAAAMAILGLGFGGSPLPTRLRHLPGVAGIAGFLEAADIRLSRHPRLLLAANGWQAAIFLLDAATMWVLIHAVGSTAPASVVFATFMVANVFRTVSFSPGGLGTYEAASVLTLRLAGVGLPAALAATLLFRGLSFWAPMVPGLWASRHMLRPPAQDDQRGDFAYWSVPADEVASRLQSQTDGLSTPDAKTRLDRYGPNTLADSRSRTWFHVLGNQLRSPLLLLLVFAAIASGLTQEWFDAGMVLVIVVTTVLIGFVREYSAETAARALRARLHVRAKVLRDGRVADLAASAIVPGDVVLLSAGSLVPGDGVLLDAADFFVSESVLTGESFPVEKRPGVVESAAGLAQRTNCVFSGTNVRSGSARCLIVETGARTAFGAIAARLARKAPEAEFDRGLRHFGYLLTTAMLVLVLAVFAAHVLRGRPAVETLLFSIALAVGLSPELLPAILSINLARGARMLAGQGVLVRRLNAIENLGSMDVLCTDKTGTLTEGVVRAQDAFDPFGAPAPDVFKMAAYNAQLETGLSNPLDDAILQAHQPDLSGIEKCGEVPFDFARRRVTVVVTDTRSRQTVMITKGAFLHVLDACTRLEDGRVLDSPLKTAIIEHYESWSRQGIRVLAVATRDIAVQSAYSRADECDMVFRGFITFLDRPKEGVTEALAALAALGVSFKLITGDNGLVAKHVAGLVGLRAERLVTGRELNELHGGALFHAVQDADVFAEVDPGQKERIILALKRAGHVVGFLGDGVNDAPAMHAADTSLSVEAAVDVAREAADFVLLERGLDVIRRGVEAGRRTFANTIKYVLITTSANLGNMVSMAAASMVLPFLPLQAGQILLNNLLSDIPAVGLADDGVDEELVARPERWDIRFIGRFMIVFGLISSLFDVITFGMLRLVFHAGPETFRTTWFVESLLTELLVALVVRTRRPFFRSRPGNVLIATTIGVTVIALALPFAPGASTLGFVHLSGSLLATILGITATYVAATELAKAGFYRTRRTAGR